VEPLSLHYGSDGCEARPVRGWRHPPARSVVRVCNPGKLGRFALLMVSLVQLRSFAGHRFVALVENDALRLLTGVESTYALCQNALATGQSLIAAARTAASAELIAYDAAYHGHEWHMLPAFDHPAEPA